MPLRTLPARPALLSSPGAPLPDGWAGKAWALQQGIEAAGGEWVVTLDADTNPDPRLPQALASRAMAEQLDLLTVGGRFDCPTPGSRWLHPAMLTTLVYRFGPPGVATAPDRAMANGQCMAVPRQSFLERGGMQTVRGEVVEDIALARRMAHDGARVGFLDAGEMLEVRMFESLGDTWRGWGRSLALPGVEPRAASSSISRWCCSLRHFRSPASCCARPTLSTSSCSRCGSARWPAPAPPTRESMSRTG